jgi:hypothetical protein
MADPQYTATGSRPLRIVCAWCGWTMTDGLGPISHGLCDLCQPLGWGAAVARVDIDGVPIYLRAVRSSYLDAVGWHSGRGADAPSIFVVRFASGRVCIYRHVTRAQFVGLLGAPSQGRYFHAEIRQFPDRYPWEYCVQPVIPMTPDEDSDA